MSESRNAKLELIAVICWVVAALTGLATIYFIGIIIQNPPVTVSNILSVVFWAMVMVAGIIGGRIAMTNTKFTASSERIHHSVDKKTTAKSTVKELTTIENPNKVLLRVIAIVCWLCILVSGSLAFLGFIFWAFSGPSSGGTIMLVGGILVSIVLFIVGLVLWVRSYTIAEDKESTVK